MHSSNIDSRGDVALRTVIALSCVLGLLALSRAVHAVPSFARQTGLACETCHTVFPELTPFGRQFKLNGYTFYNKFNDASTNYDGFGRSAGDNNTLYALGWLAF